MQLTILGSGGWIPTSSRQTSCYLVVSGTEALILDAGTGLGALHIDPALVDGVETVTVLLSHFHLDHVVGLGLVGRGLGDRELTIAGPGALSYGRSTRSIVEGRLLDSPFQTTSPVPSARWAEIGNDPLSFANHHIDTWVQTRHPLPSTGFRVGNRFAYCTDTEFDPQTIDQVTGVGTLLHEAWEPADAERGHTCGRDAATIAVEAAVSRLVLTHSHPLPDVAGRTAAAAHELFATTVSATDGARLEL